MQSVFTVNGAMVHLSEKAVHLSHTIFSNDCECITLAARNNFWKSYNILVSNFGHLYSFNKTTYLSLFAVFFFYGSPLWYLGGAVVQSLCVN